jgi:squalene cyclase
MRRHLLARQCKATTTKALQRAVRFLLGAQGPDGLWSDFETFAGESDEWVTAYVATALAGVEVDDVSECLRNAWRAMCRRRRPAGGWGYNKKSPADSDSTAWGLRMASALGKSHSVGAIRAGKFLARQQCRDGGIATCSPSAWGGHFSRMAAASRWAGWCDSHACVTGAAVISLNQAGRRSALRFLRKRQGSRGRWSGYWWGDQEYATALAVVAFAEPGSSGDELIARRGFTWLARRINSSGDIISELTGEPSAFAAGCALAAFAQHGGEKYGKVVERLLQRLINHQRRDGSWSSSATLRIPFPDDVAPESFDYWTLGDGFGNICLDHKSLFTTAAVVAALKHYDLSNKV